MLRKIIAAAALLALFGLFAADAAVAQKMGTISSNNTNAVITWDWGTKSITVSPISNAILLRAFRGGAAVDSVTIRASHALKFQALLFDSVRVERSDSTAVTWVTSTEHTDGMYHTAGDISVGDVTADMTSTNLILTDIDTKLTPGDTITTRLNQIGHWTRLTRGSIVTGNASLLDLETLLEAVEPDVDTLVTRATLANLRLANIRTSLSDSLTPTLTNELLRAIRDSLGTLDLGDISMSAVEGKLDTVISTIEGMWTALETDMVSAALHTAGTIDTAGTAGGGDTLVINLGDIRSYAQMYVRINATAWGDSLVMQVGSSDNNGWDTGNTCYFDFSPSPGMPQITHFMLAAGGSSYGTYGVTIPLQDQNGAWLPGPYGVLRFINYGGTGQQVTGFTVMGLYGKGR